VAGVLVGLALALWIAWAARHVLTTIAAIVTIMFLTLFMVLEGPAWVERALVLVLLGVPFALALGLLVAILDRGGDARD
jgi:hypothetical protein